MALEVTDLALEDMPEDVSGFEVLDKTGHTKHTWKKKDPEDIKEARKLYETLTGAGYKAFNMSKKGHKGTIMKDFDAEAGRVLFVPQFQGG